MHAVVGYHRPESLEEALSLLDRGNPRTVVLAGGTSLNAIESTDPFEVIDLQSIGFDAIRTDGTMVEIGAMVRLDQLAAHPAVPQLLQELARREGPNTLRNAATVGGTIATANPESELVAGCLVFAGQVILAGLGGATRTVDLSELLADRSLIEGAIITTLRIATDGAAAAARTGRTPSDTSIVAAVARRTNSGVRLALTGMTSAPILIDPDQVDTLQPPGDFRGSSEYRLHLARTLAARVIGQLAEQP